MQLQIECNTSKHGSQVCCVCSHRFALGQAKVILCDDQGAAYGEVCSACLHNGFDWIKQEFEYSNLLHKTAYNQYRSRKRDVPLSA
ncbi:hypothetical protein [Myxacorys almedinensis]|uniref:Uncharacterized protein n=1 Tax=Myxacorys almedinensis A TaxID=2690445 RepID=A0A8J8CN90_9CYAN|nr:hypothetical protein [Myxacorys almedinensis]NDJ18167.1 hypothetical protein [Myxacorys almedinensis A]